MKIHDRDDNVLLYDSKNLRHDRWGFSQIKKVRIAVAASSECLCLGR